MKAYKNNKPYSYALGAYTSIELLKNKPKLAQQIVFSQNIRTPLKNKILEYAKEYDIPFQTNEKTMQKLQNRKNTYVITQFKKWQNQTLPGNHILLERPSTLGNIGTIMRAALGFNFQSIAIIEPAADYFDPGCIIASMGAIFSLNIATFDSFESYKKTYGNHACYAFVLDTDTIFSASELRVPYTLIFGNESSGLSEDFYIDTQLVRIAHSSKIDSLNLAMASTIAMYESQKK